MTTIEDPKALSRTLNKLIETCKDGEAGFKACADDVKSAELKRLLQDRALQCASAADELQRCVLELGGTPEDSTSVGADLHRRWVDLKSLVTGKDEKAILNEAERGEDVAKARYAEALRENLPSNIRDLVQRQYEGVLRNHDQVKALRDIERAKS